MLRLFGKIAILLADARKSLLMGLRFGLMRGHKGLHLDKPSFIARTARFKFNADGWNLGGSITAAAGLRLSDGVIVAPYGGRITIGRNVYIGPYSVLYGHGGLSIGDNVQIAGQCMFIPSNHNFSDFDLPINAQGESMLGITIADDVWIGGGCRVLDGVTIGRGAVVAAGAVVTSSVEPFAVVAGVPAQIIRLRGSSDIDRETVRTRKT